MRWEGYSRRPCKPECSGLEIETLDILGSTTTFNKDKTELLKKKQNPVHQEIFLSQTQYTNQLLSEVNKINIQENCTCLT